MDIAGAKALKERLGKNEGHADPPASAEVSEGAPPVYHYLGVSERPSEAPGEPPVDERHGRPHSWLRRLGLTFR